MKGKIVSMDYGNGLCFEGETVDKCLNTILSISKYDQMISRDMNDNMVNGLCWYSSTVICVSKYDSNSELIIVNRLDHSMRLFESNEREVLNEVDLSEMKENWILDLSDEGSMGRRCNE